MHAKLSGMAVALLILVASGTAQATLIGDTVTASLSPVCCGVSVVSQYSSPAVVGDGVEFTGTYNIFGLSRLDLDVNAAGFTLILTDGAAGGIPFLRVDLGDLNWVGQGGVITGINNLGTTGTGTIELDSFGFTEDSAFVVLSRLVGSGTQSFSFDVQHAVAIAVPEPATLSLLALGLLGLGLARRYKVA